MEIRTGLIQDIELLLDIDNDASTLFEKAGAASSKTRRRHEIANKRLSGQRHSPIRVSPEAVADVSRICATTHCRQRES